MSGARDNWAESGSTKADWGHRHAVRLLTLDNENVVVSLVADPTDLPPLDLTSDAVC